MHELFLTAFIEGSDVDQARSFLEGYCAMSASQAVKEIVYFAGPQRPRGLPNLKPFFEEQKMDRQQLLRLWNELAQVLSRQSYVLQGRYDISRDKHFGPGAEESDPYAKGAIGTLRWTDIPDPTSKDAVAIRKKIDIPNQRDLANILKETTTSTSSPCCPGIEPGNRSNSSRYKSSAIEESYNYYNDGIEFSIFRHRTIPDDTNTSPPPPPPAPARATSAVPAPRKVLPAWDETEPVDPAGRWTVQVRAVVLDDSTPDSVRAAHDSLIGLQAQLRGVLDFQVFDRRVHDTRIAPRTSNTPIPLPQIVASVMGGRA